MLWEELSRSKHDGHRIGLEDAALNDSTDFLSFSPLGLALLAWMPAPPSDPAGSYERQQPLALLRVLLRLGADPNRPDGVGRTPLAIAAACVNAEAIEVLLEAGADPNVKSDARHLLTLEPLPAPPPPRFSLMPVPPSTRPFWGRGGQSGLGIEAAACKPCDDSVPVVLPTIHPLPLLCLAVHQRGMSNDLAQCMAATRALLDKGADPKVSDPQVCQGRSCLDLLISGDGPAPASTNSAAPTELRPLRDLLRQQDKGR